MNRVNLSPKTVLIAIATALLAWGLYLSIEFYDETIQSSWSREALRNPYLAAQQFLSESGSEVIEADNLVDLSPLGSDATLFISEPNQVLNPRQLKEVKRWLQEGGHLIYAANTVAHDDDLLLAEFDVVVEFSDYDEDESEEKPLSETIREYNRQIEEGKSREEISESFNRDSSLTVVEMGGAIGDLDIEFDDNKVLTHPYITGSGYDADKPQPVNWHFSDFGIHMMQFDWGQGRLTLISDPGVWTSYRIDQYDHAYLLWILAGKGGVFAALRPVLQDSIWVLISRNAFELLLAAGMLIALLIWHMGHRFGRLIPRDLSKTRALAEHFSSISHYLWHRRHGEYLIAPLRQRVTRRAGLVLGEFALADSGRQIELLAEHCDLNADAIRRALLDNEFTETTFVQKVRLLKRIEQSL